MTNHRRGFRLTSFLRLAGYLIAGVPATTGLVMIYLGVIRLSLPSIAIGALSVLMAAFLSLVLPNEMRQLAEGRADAQIQQSGTSEEMARDSFSSEHRRRRIAFGIAAIPLFAFLFLVAWSTYSGRLRPSVEGIAAVAFLLIVLLLVAIYAALDVIMDRRFVVSEAGFVPRRVPIRRALRGSPLIEFGEVAGVILANNDPNGKAVFLRLVDGAVVALHERDGIPKESLERLVEFLRARGLVPGESSSP